jgi:pimeloyl-ACP methyl ester carboxylesterase
MPNPNATATLILLPGGDAATGKIVEGKPGSGNFLSRSRDDFFAANFNVIVVYRASDMNDLDYRYRVSKEHVGELAKVIAYAKQNFGKPVWLVGTSRGTVSGTAAAIALGESAVQGLVLTSSITSIKTGAISTQNIASLKIPTLVVHHKNDACNLCVPAEASRITDYLKSAPVKKFIMIEGGSNPSGDPCAARHWHGFINFEKETVKMITDWIQNPQG